VNVANTDDEQTARAELSWLAEPGDRLLGTLVRANGAVYAMTLIRAGRLPRDAGLAVTFDAQRAMNRWHAALAKVPPRGEILRAMDGRFRLVCPGHAEWAAGLDGLGDAAPIALWVTGQADLRFSCLRSAAVTGSRAATAYGSYIAAEISAFLGAQGLTVISGGSYGVDASAHRGALGADGVTIAVMAGGIDVPYPAAHADLFGAIAAHGALVSEAPPGTMAGRLRFQARNRVIAALAAGTVIVEASTRGGAMTVARHARDLGRPVMAVPGPVTSDLSAGCNDLIRCGNAVLVTSASDVIDTLTATGHSVS
jgi:DNA processing protein